MIDRLHPADSADCLEKANFASGAHHLKRSHPILSNSSLAKKIDVRGKESRMSNRGFDEYGHYGENNGPVQTKPEKDASQ